MPTQQTLNGSINSQPTLKGHIYSPEFLTAYDIAVQNGFEGNRQEWLDSLVGPEGKSAYEIAVENGFNGTIDQWLSQIGGVADHNVLLNRDDQDCHPISAITGLKSELSHKQDDVGIASHIEILEMLNDVEGLV